MKNTLKIFGIIAVAALIGFSFVSCDHDVYMDGFTPVTGVTLDQTTLSLAEGDTATLVATVAPADAGVQTVTWSTSDATKATVTAAGVVEGIAAGTATITVTTTDGGKTATCVVTVTAP